MTRLKYLASVTAVLGFIFLALILLTNALMSNKTEYTKTAHNYKTPDVLLLNQDGKTVNFRAITAQDRVVVLNFIYGECRTICPVQSIGYVNFQNRLGSESNRVKLLSVVIDQENNTPLSLKEYLTKLKARPGWDLLTGSRNSIDSIITAFEAHAISKMESKPLTFIYSPSQKQWFRIYGLLTVSNLIYEYKKAL
jgi:protein SCO1/2